MLNWYILMVNICFTFMHDCLSSVQAPLIPQWHTALFVTFEFFSPSASTQYHINCFSIIIMPLNITLLEKLWRLDIALANHLQTGLSLFDKFLIRGTEEIQFMPELWRFDREKEGWEPQKTLVRKGGEEELLPVLSIYCAFGFPSTLGSVPVTRHSRQFRPCIWCSHERPASAIWPHWGRRRHPCTWGRIRWPFRPLPSWWHCVLNFGANFFEVISRKTSSRHAK